MSLCIAVNNPGNFVIISGDGRITSASKIVSDSHKKLTKLTDHVSMFCSGAQDYCEMLRSLVAKQVNESTSIEQITRIVERESLRVHKQFLIDYPTYYDVVPDGACLATVLAFYDIDKGECGMIEYCHRSGFDPRIVVGSAMSARGGGQDKALIYLPKHFNPHNPIESVLNVYRIIGEEEESVGGDISIHVISEAGTKEYVVEGAK
ncbi:MULTISPECIES: hypothetical protein [Paenibacillus]|uniref:hypothetical protein n=1 Tax=Paenibacillus TaxID=44249 RepID=UPI00096E241C|nr:hypothetical protein [Paenibacillus odorifer]OMD80435.1 hypothetical protein BSK53_20465 [Paenibacillus odorifer]